MVKLLKGQWDGFFGLALDNLIQVLLIIGLCGSVLKFPVSMIVDAVLPGVAVSLLIGNVAYSWMALQLARKEGREDVCALPYGINTPSVFIFVFLVMLPVKLAAQSAGASEEQQARLAWQAGLAACFGSALIELAGAFVGEWMRKLAPRPAMLATLSGVALGFISLPFLYRTFASPVVGFSTLAVMLVAYFGRVRFRGGISGGFVAVALGTALAWSTGLAPAVPRDLSAVGLHLPHFAGLDLWESVRRGDLAQYFNIIFPIGAFNVIGSLQNLESAEAAGDRYPTAQAMAINGVGSIAAALFGSCFPTTIYIGHPGWKAMGARVGYSVLSGAFMTAVGLSGTAALLAWAVPVEAGMAIVLWIGIVISAQAFAATPQRHFPAVVLGIMVGLAAFGTLMAKAGLRAADAVTGGTLVWSAKSAELSRAFLQSDVAVDGLFSVEQGTIFSAMIFAALAVEIIDRRFRHAAAWALGGAVLSMTGLVHAFAWGFKDATLQLVPAWKWAAGYGLVAVLLFLAEFVTVPADDAPHA
jgi:AGZA family xanthine/uracil permease-like MFS transporter